MASKIEWTNETWSPITGCTKISEGCKNCYAKRMSKRLAGRFGYPADKPFRVTLHPDKLDQPLKWKKPRMIFVCSMGDLFHEDVPESYISKVFDIMIIAQHHTYQILTKRPQRMKEWIKNNLYESCDWSFLWIGISCENQETADERIPILLQIPAKVRFVSCEPLLEEIDLQWHLWETSGLAKEGIDWVIVGGESGPNARPMHPDWVRSLRDQCQEAGIPFFFKQWGEWRFNPYMTSMPYHTRFEKIGKKRAGRLLDGQEWNEYPIENTH